MKVEKEDENNGDGIFIKFRCRRIDMGAPMGWDDIIVQMKSIKMFYKEGDKCLVKFYDQPWNIQYEIDTPYEKVGELLRKYGLIMIESLEDDE